jgi:hypothetical protein
MVQPTDVGLVEKAKDAFLELAAALSWDDLYQIDALLNGLLHNAVEFGVDQVAAVVEIMEIQL